MGHEVQVLTGYPNYPSGKLEPGYKIRLYRIEKENDVKIIRVPLYPSHDYSSIKRSINYASFALAAATIGVLLADKPDVVYVYYPPSTLFLPAMVMKYIWGVPLLFNIQDIWPDAIMATGMLRNSAWARAIEAMERVSRRIASHIITISPGFKGKLVERGVSPDKISVIYNWCDDSVIQPAEGCEGIAEDLGLNGKFIVTYAGNIGKAQALDTILEVAAILEDRRPDFLFVFVGGGVDSKRLAVKAKQMGLGNTMFMDRMLASEVAKILSISDVLLVHLRDEPLFKITIPSKTQAYMAIGKPILMAVRGDAASLVEYAGAGISCIPEDKDSIVNALERFFMMTEEERIEMGRSGRIYYQENLALNIAAERVVDICYRLIEENM